MNESLILVSERLRAVYRNFLLTEFWFREPLLRDSFTEALGRLELVREPYLELVPRYRPGGTPREILRELLREEPLDAFLNAMHGDRPLYQHQEEALRRSWLGRNVVVATGTGSGKTEAFLLPILLYLYQEWLQGKLGPGVRALILYPMNALAFDQRARLAEIARVLKEQDSPFHFTFGQYTGNTPENWKDTKRGAAEWEEWRGAHTICEDGRVMHGELIYREEMRSAPPHILITNYSMLEYLLIRPNDSPFFDNGAGRSWRFLVVDEAHTYSGIRGQELGLLLRRLKERLRQGGSDGNFRCIATSATLFAGDDARSRAADFANRLFGESFSLEDVIVGERGRLVDSLPPTVESELRERVTRLEEVLRDGPRPLDEIAGNVFPDEEMEQRNERLLSLLDLLSKLGDAPFARLRFHIFVRGLDGAYIRFSPSTKIVLSNENDETGKVFEIALCRECGQHYLVGQVKGDYFGIANRDYSSIDFRIDYLLPVERSEEATHRLCPVCGRLVSVSSSCCVESERMISVRYEREAHDYEKGELRYCVVCGSRGTDPVREIVYGPEWPQAVITTSLLEMLPPDRQKLLAFADGRQDAAYFAVRLDVWARDLAERRAIVAALEHASEEECRDGFSLDDLHRRLLVVAPQIFRDSAAASPGEVRRAAWVAVIRELTATEDSRSITSAGLGYWRLAWPGLQEIPPEIFGNRLPPSARVGDVVEVLLLTLVPVQAVALERVCFDMERSQLKYVKIGAPASDSTVVSWDGVEGRTLNRRVDYLVRVFKSQNNNCDEAELRSQARECLRRVWEWLLRSEQGLPEQDRLLVPHSGKGFQLNPRWLRLIPFREGQTALQCTCCGRISVQQGCACPRYRCPGVLEPVPDPFSGGQFYREVYRNTGSLQRFLVEEHTAQLTNMKAYEYQTRFSKGNLHVLSCSTTFELGVDLGSIDVVFMRNVPPEPFNYAQRAGRVGRRQRAGLVVTYCRNRPHDLYHFMNPQRLLNGHAQTMVPRAWSDRVIERHVTALVFSWYFRCYPTRFGDVEQLIGGDWKQPALLQILKEFIQKHRSILEEEIAAVLGETEAIREDWLNKIVSSDGVLARALAEVGEDYLAVLSFEEVSRNARRYSDADWARRRAETIAREDVLSFLSRKAVIPKYGFPVDVVELMVPDSSKEVELTRDLRLAIAEYAPGQTVIANKYEWRSGGLKVVASRALPRRQYRACFWHGSYVEAEYSGPNLELSLPCGCRGEVGEYVQPLFGFFVPRGEKWQKRSSFRPRVSLATLYFVDQGHERDPLPSFSEYGRPPCLRVSAVTRRTVVVLTKGERGRGFLICLECGTWLEGNQARRHEHSGRNGRPCGGQPMRVALGHSFVTDVVRLDFLLPVPGRDVFALSHGLVAAIVAGVSLVLEIPHTEVGGTPVYGDSCPAIVLFDDVPAGGGVVARLEKATVLRSVLEQARDRLNGSCGCGPDGSCYACLRTYRNQSLHSDLRRGLVYEYLNRVLEHW
ncbi:DEAD/DEAH box helicase [Thermomicrobium sp. CFH 73360]|uniref:DEAD/DEAH box helicase n=1 Tax=Thermomicrobium sp. CFH 73360 TaxID=2951987 RepID=UPI002076EA3C|nr:DEAD/DEAH box helicase [Thermomicrobium sp. CFH 73360]MCM8746417.1 DEAD/DEAH box helicase [Thermomicrobium sp. CFH 73360]